MLIFLTGCYQNRFQKKKANWDSRGKKYINKLPAAFATKNRRRIFLARNN